MRTVAIIQARKNSTRLPNKIMADICGKTMLQRVVEQVKKTWSLSDVVVATPDDEVALYCSRVLACNTYVGNEEDVLDRYYRTADAFKADIIVRITADCPLIDPKVINGVQGRFLEYPHADYASNVMPRTFPRGLDVEVFSFGVLMEAWTLAKGYDRLHVTPYMRDTERFGVRNLENCADCSGMLNPDGTQFDPYDGDYSHYRWTVDEQADLEFVRAVYSELDDFCYWKDVIKLLEEKPELVEINKGIKQKEG